MGVFLKFLLSKSKKGLWLIAVGLLAISSANADVMQIVINDNNTSTVDYNGTLYDLNVTKNGSIDVDNNYTSVYTNKLIDHFILNDGNISTTDKNNTIDARADGITINGDLNSSNITNDGNITANAESNSTNANAVGIRTYGVTDSSIINSKNITATADSNNSDAQAVGIDTYAVTNSNITNSGNITATADSNSSDAVTYGIRTNGDVTDSNITNDGNITAAVNSNDSHATTAGIAIDGSLTNSNIKNNGNITATAKSSDGSGASAYGIRTQNLIDSNITNNDNITATAESNDSVAKAYGILTNSLLKSNITNDGNIVANAESDYFGTEVAGIYTNGSVTDSIITNGGNIVANADSNSSGADAYGIFTEGYNVTGSNMTNSGNITVNAESSDSFYTRYTRAYGIQTGSVTDSNITNSGDINATAKSNGSNAEADGIHTDNLDYSNITNSKNIVATADSNGSNANADAYGIYIYNYFATITNSNITNSGNITTTAKSNSAGGAYGIYTVSDINNSNITNSGTITANSNGNHASAFGILTYGATDSNITNSGNITATAESDSIDNAAAYGIHTAYVTDSNITNSGNITTNATSNNSVATAFGIDIGSAEDSNIINNKNIIINTESNNSSAYAYGIVLSSPTTAEDSNITNKGNIIATATSNNNSNNTHAYGIYIEHSVKSNITNSGNIIATATNNNNINDTLAYGIYIDNAEDSTITNSGTITAKINNDFAWNGFAIFLSNSDSNSTISNTQTGKLYGNIHINGTAKVINQGLIALPYNANGEGTAYIGGNLTNTGTIQIAMLTDGNISNTKYSQLQVGGNAIFNPGSILDVNVLATSANTKLLIGEQLKNVVSVDGNLTVNALNVTDNSRLLDFNYVKNDNNISLDIVKGLTILDSTIQGGGNSNARSAAAVLDKINDNTPPASMDNFYGKLNLLSTDTEIAKAVDSTLSYTDISNIGASNAILDNMFGVVNNQGNGGLNSGDKLFREKRVWIKPFGNFGKQKDKDSIHGFDFNAQGVGIGADGEYSDNAYAGIAFFFSRANVNVNGANQSSDLDNYSALIYGKTPIVNGKANLRYKASASWQKTDSQRYIALTNETAKASYTSNLYAIDVRVEKDMKTYNNILLEPMIGATYKYIHSPSYSENGSSTNLSVNSSDTKKLTTYLGAKAYYKLNETSTLNGKINVGYDVTHDDIDIVSAYSASPNNKFTTNGIDNGRWSYSASVGYKKHISNQDDINLRYEYYGESSSYYNNTISLTYLHKF